MKARKLSRREAALVAHARRRAVADFCDNTTVEIYTVESKDGGMTHRRVLRCQTLANLKNLNVLLGVNPFTIDLVQRWRE